MTFQCVSFQSFDADKSIREHFGDEVAFLFAVTFDKDEVQVLQAPNCQVGAQPDFPKTNISRLGTPTHIMVIPWDASPGCRTCIINGKMGTCCS